MWVRAKVRSGEERKVAGYYDYRRRYEGEVFEIANKKALSDIWMERVDAPVVSSESPVTEEMGKAHKAMQTSQLMEG